VAQAHVTVEDDPAPPGDLSNSPYGGIATGMSPIDRDYMIRTVMGEAGSDPSASGVAAVIANRMKSTGQSAKNVVLAPNQFEAWQRQNLAAVPTTAPAYKNAAKVVDNVLSGTTPDPTGGATMFYSPTAQKALGRTPPAWDDGTGQTIGAHKFFGGNPDPANDPLVQKYMKPSAPQTPANSNAPTASAPDLSIDPLVQKYMNAAAPAPAAQSAPVAPETATGTANNIVRGLSSGMPIIGGALNMADAATNATLAPALNPMFAPQNQLQGDTWSQRYANALKQQQGMDTGFAAAHPYLSGAANIAGGVAATIPAMAAAPAAFGVSAGMPMLARGLASGVTGAGIGGADAFVRSGGDPSAAVRGAEWGGGLGALAPPVGAAIGAGVGSIANRLASVGPGARNIAERMAESGLNPWKAQSDLTAMGPNATLADIEPSLTSEAGGLAQKGGAPTSILRNAMMARAAGADDRVSQAIDQTLGPKPDLEMAKSDIVSRAQTAAGPWYNAARENGTPLNITPVLNSIDAQLKDAVGGEAAILAKAKGYLTDAKVGIPGPDGKPTTMIVPKSDPGALLKVRQALDGDIQSMERNATIDGTSAGKSAYRAANDIRSQIDGVLKSDPFIEEGDLAFSSQMRLKDAMDAGTKLFTRGVRPEEFQRELASMSPAEVDAYRQGARVAIGDALEQARQGVLAGARSMFGKSSANRQKLDALFPNAGDVFDMIHGEAAMRNTENVVRSGSQTAINRSIAERYSLPQNSPGGVAGTLIGEAVAPGGPGAIAGSLGSRAINALHNEWQNFRLGNLMKQSAQGLSASGADAQKFLGEVQRAFATMGAHNALSNGAARVGNLLTRSIPPSNYFIGGDQNRNALAVP